MAGVPWNIIGLCNLLKQRVTSAEQEKLSSDQSVAAPALEVDFGLGASAIAGLPMYKYEQKGGVGATEECAVWLGEIRAKEIVKRLPVCTHGCIDMWLRSHRTCPVCRTPVDAAAVPATEELDSRTHGN